MKNTIELTIPRTPGPNMRPFCHRCMRAAESFTVTPEMWRYSDGDKIIAYEYTGGMTVEVKCHGEEWHAHLRGDGTWAIRAVA
jgi:hypothetical protein